MSKPADNFDNLKEHFECVHFGPVGDPPLDWRTVPRPASDDLDDDEEGPTDPGLIAILGFDPRTVDWNEDKDAEGSGKAKSSGSIPRPPQAG